MSGGHFDYREGALCHEMFGWGIDVLYGFGEDKYYKDCKYSKNCGRTQYLGCIKGVRKIDPMDDKMISELVYDVLCLIHSKDYSESGDTADDEYKADLKAFKGKWLKGKMKDYAKSLVDGEIESLRTELYKTLEVEHEP